MIYIISRIKKEFAPALRGFAQKTPEINSAMIYIISRIKKEFAPADHSDLRRKLRK
jgi:hypothetical protein